MTLAVGHRGAADLEPENTLRSFRRAIELGVDLVECDVHLSSDGHLPVIHDDTVDRTTNGTGNVRDLTLAELRELDAGQGERIPTLAEVLEVVRDRVKLIIELKGEGTARPAVEAVKEKGMAGEAVFTCFDEGRLREVLALDPSLTATLLLGDPPPDSCARALALGAAGISVYHAKLTEALVTEAHDCGLLIRTWTPNTEGEIRAALAKGVDGIASDRPDLLLQVLGR